MSKRLFIALPLPKDALKTLQKYRDEMGTLTPFAKWTPAGNLHVTLLFLGNVAPSAVDMVVFSLREKAAQTPPLSLLVRRAVYAPQVGKPNMIWLQCVRDPAFSALAEALALQLSVLETGEGKAVPELDASSHQWENPHLTLARFKRTVEPSRLIRLRKTGLENQTLAFFSCLLMESKLTSAGPLYREISTCTFIVDTLIE